ncbi:MAG: PAS domain-containing sensor histidine kinase [Anaerolineales bacterium]|jgi:PAS domain S-box-containing protein
MQIDNRDSLTQFRFLPVLAVILILLYLVTALSIPDVIEASLLPASLLLIIRFLAVRAVVHRIRVSADSHIFRFWRFLGAGLLLWLLADMVWLAMYLYSGSSPKLPSLADLLRLSGYFAIIFGVLFYPRASSEYEGFVREGLDVSIILLSILSIVWLALIKSSLMQHAASVPLLFWSYLTPFLDFFLIVLIVRSILILEFAPAVKVTFYLLLSFLILGVTDVIDAYRLIIALPEPSQVIWIGRMVAIALIATIATQPWQTMQAFRDDVRHPGTKWGSVFSYLLPIAFMLSALILIFFDWWISREPDWFGVASAGLLALFLFARQGTIMGQQEMRQFKALVNATQDVAFICSADGKLRLVNPALEDMLSSSFESDSNAQISEFMAVNRADTDDITQVLETASKSGWSGEVDLIRSDGSSFPALVSLSPFENIRWGGVFLAGTAHDLSPIKDREDRLREALEEVDAARAELAELNAVLELKVEERTNELQTTIEDLAKLNEELQTLDQLKSDFVALVSHELRAPLTNIRSGIELVLERGAELDHKTYSSLELVQSEIHRLMYFVESILDLSALEAGGFQFEMIPLDLEASALSAYSRLSPKQDLGRIHICMDEKLPAVLADERALGSVFFHLFDNSLKYAPEGDIEVVAVEGDDRVLVEIRDEGPGIPEDQQDNVFEMFHRLDASDAREIYGHGLGLPTVRRFVEAMGGSVGIAAEEGVGTRIKFWLQKAEER